MSKTSDKQSSVMGKLSAINTLLNNYPVLTATDPLLTNFSINTSVGFMLSILEVFGVTQADIINWICKLLGVEEGKSDCVLDAIELAIKIILLTNIKNLYTCSVNPLIPDNLMKYAVQQGSRPDPYDPLHTDVKDCIEIKIKDIDLFGLLANCPSSKEGGIFYFDASEPSDEGLDIGGNLVFKPHYTPNELWKSRDFNAFLWYVINKGNIGSPEDTQRNTWDNRVQQYKFYQNNSAMEENFFHINLVSTPKWPPISTPNIPISGTTANDLIYKKQLIICQYSEHTNSDTDVLKVWINADRYYKTRHIKYIKKINPDKSKVYGTLDLNRTIFEFNYDYIFSLKLFDTKTVVANIINSLLGLASSLSLSASFSLQMRLVKKQVELIVDEIISHDDTSSEDDCYFSFDNSTYDTLLQSAVDEYNGMYSEPNTAYDPRFEGVFESLQRLDSSATREPGVTVTTQLADTIVKVMGIEAENQRIKPSFQLTFGINFITDFLKQTIIQIVLQVLSPKVAMLYAINASVMGGEAGDFKEWEKFIKNSKNLIVLIVKQVKDIILKELYKFMMEKLSPILKLFIAKLALETIKDYKDLITNLLLNCIPNIKFPKRPGTVIDNVQYADIVPSEITPTVKPC